jgi:hypothetical protein
MGLRGFKEAHFYANGLQITTRCAIRGLLPTPQIYHELKTRQAQRVSLLELRTKVSNLLHALTISTIAILAARKHLMQWIETYKQ